MVRAFALALLALLLAAGDADAARRWCWPFDFSCQQRSHRKAPRVRAHKHVPAVAEPDCEQINRAVKVLPPDRLARAMKRSTAKQKATIMKCAEQGSQP